MDETYLPLALGRKVVENDLEVYPIFSLLEGKYDTPLLEADYRIEAIAADPFVAEALGVEDRSPILLIERVSYSLDQTPGGLREVVLPGRQAEAHHAAEETPVPDPARCAAEDHAEG